MAKEHLYSVFGASATPAERITLTEAGLLERQHLQEWVLSHPEILGEEVLVITFEFDRWLTGVGTATWERLDVLGLDRAGRLVVAELKRDRAPDAVVVQALNYAAMASRFNLDLLGEAFRERLGGEQSTIEPLDELRAWASALSDETLAPPRIVLVAEDFGPVLTNTAMFLIEQGLDLRLIRVQLYRMANNTLALTVSQLLPVPDAEEFMVRPRSAPSTRRAARTAAARRASIPDRLVAAEVFSEGDDLHIVVPPGVQEDSPSIIEWLEQEPERDLVRWRQDPRAPVEWAVDRRPWNLTALIRRVIEEATGAPARTQVWGPNWFQTQDGIVLHKVAEPLLDAREADGRFDWSQLHELLVRLPEARWDNIRRSGRRRRNGASAAWTTHRGLRRLPERVASSRADGRPRPNFAWTDAADARTQEEVLAAEGVQFRSGSADLAQRLSAAELNELIPGE